MELKQRQLHKAQEEIASDTHRFRVANCGRKFGKTVLSEDEISTCGFSKNGVQIAYIAPTYGEARDIMWNPLKRRTLPIQAIKPNETRLELELNTQDGGKSIVYLKGWESIESLRGMQFDFLVLDEIAKYRNFWAGWHEVLRATLTPRQGKALLISTPRGFNHFYDLYNLEQKNPDYKSFHFTSYDNPYVSPEEIEKVKLELTEDQFAQEYLADFRKLEGLVYKEFNRDKHLVDFAPSKRRTTERMIGIDFGFVNPACILLIYKDEDSNYYVVSEWYKSGKTDMEIAEYASSLESRIAYPDPENPSGIEELKRKGVNIRDVIKGKGSVMGGINKVKELFKQNRLYIHKDCINLIQELETYAFDPDSKDEKPVKENDHACFVKGTIVNGKRIEDIGVQTGVEDVYKYNIAGKELICTKNHPICTQRGLVEADTLRYNDIVWRNKSLFIEVSGGTGIRTILSGLKGITFVVVQRIVGARIRDYTDLYGKRKTELSRKDFMSIILMATPSIIHWIILSLFTAMNTLLYIGLKKSENWLKRISRKLFKPLPIGLKLKTANVGGMKWANGILNTFSIEGLLFGNAICVESNIKHKEMDGTGFATPTVVRKHYVGQEPVYNVRTRSGMYLANGIVTSNCDALRYALSMNIKSGNKEVSSYTPRLREFETQEKINTPGVSSHVPKFREYDNRDYQARPL